MTSPSTRQALEAVARVQATRSEDVILGLAMLEQEIGWADVMPGLCAEHQAAVDRIFELHSLIDHLAANLRGGYGVPPTPPPAPERKQMAPLCGRQVASNMASHRKPQTPQAHHMSRNAKGGRTDGLLNHEEAAKATGYSKAGFHVARKAGRIPEPVMLVGKSPFWRKDQLAGITPMRPGRRGKA